MSTTLALLFAASLWAGAQNTLAGGGSFVTFSALLLAGANPLAANITSSVALFPSQALAGWATRSMAAGPQSVGLRALLAISLAGGAAGALLLLVTPAAFFDHIVPYLVLFATAVFAWGSFGRRGGPAPTMPPAAVIAIQAAIAVYGGYFGGGIGFMMMAALAMAGVGARAASASKNILAGVINAAAVVVFAASPQVLWVPAAVLCAGSMLGSLGGAWMLRRVPETLLRAGIVVIGLALTAGLFLRRA